MSNAIWHRHNHFVVAASIETRLAWYLTHAANCGCIPIPDWALAEFSARGIRLPEGYGEAWRARGPLGAGVSARHVGGRGTT
jgi:hypothetical protein